MESRYRRVSGISPRGGEGMEGPYERVLLKGFVRVRSTVLKAISLAKTFGRRIP